MRWPRSLRGRVVFAAAFWTAGLFGFTVLVVNHLPRVAMVLLGLHRHPWWMALVSVCGMSVGVAVLRGMLRSMDDLRSRVGQVRAGQRPHVDGHYPSEVQPLVDDLNSLLAHQQHAISRATAKAGDLAHGLKTPLAVLGQEADRAEAAGAAETADTIRLQVERMRRHVEYHLAHARAAASGATPGARCDVRGAADALARTLRRLHAQRDVAIAIDVAHDVTVSVQREDLEEMLGNLLDNACKWARAQVRVSARTRGSRVGILVDDDGAGIEPPLRASVLQRGVRADEAAPGSGLGLAIVRDLAELYAGSVTLGTSPLGGLRAELDLPAA